MVVLMVSSVSREVSDPHPLAQDEYHSRGGYLTVQRFPDQPPLAWDILAGAAELGFRTNVDLNGRNQTGFTVAQANVRDGRRLSLSRAFLHPARDRPNLRVITNAMVVRVSMDGDRARGVVFHRDGALHKLRVRREVVLAAGAIQTPHLLLLSGVGPRRHLEDVGVRVVADCPGVGGNLQNHISFSVDFAVESITPGSNRLDMPAFEQFVQRLANTSALRQHGVALVMPETPGGCSELEPDSDAYWECLIRHRTNPENHQCGSARMGPDG
ncbi:Glucose dehydrogenase acceptor, partial [Frankliniella occidentalis]